jgi:hypothetical protein
MVSGGSRQLARRLIPLEETAEVMAGRAGPAWQYRGCLVIVEWSWIFDCIHNLHHTQEAVDQSTNTLIWNRST